MGEIQIAPRTVKRSPLLSDGASHSRLSVLISRYLLTETILCFKFRGGQIFPQEVVTETVGKRALQTRTGNWFAFQRVTARGTYMRNFFFETDYFLWWRCSVGARYILEL